MKDEEGINVPREIVMDKIYLVRGQKVMLDSDLANLYQVETKQLKRQVNRNLDRFPEDFMFELTKLEHDSLRSQFGTLKRGEHIKYMPFVFTEMGIAMLSSVLKSKQAVQINITIMRVFTQIRKMLTENTDLRLAVEKLERKSENHSKNIELLFQYVDELTEKKTTTKEPKKQVGFRLK